MPNTPFEDILNKVATPEFGKFNEGATYNDFLKAVQTNLGTKGTELAPQRISPFEVDISGRYPKQALGMDNEDLYAQGQSGLDQIVNGLLKGLNLVGTTFLQGTVGLLNGTLQAIADGKFSSFYDNEFSRSLDQWNKQLEDKWLPNYYSAAERERPWYKNIMTANFLGDKFIKNLGFMGGAALSGGLFAKILGSFGRASVAGNMLKAVDATEEAIRTGKNAVQLQQQLASLAGTYNNLSKAQRAIVAGLATAGEASIESLQAADQYREKLIEEYRINNGGVLPTGEALDKIDNAAANVGNTVFGLNALVLSASNYIQFPKLLASSQKAERSMFADAVRETNRVKFNPKTLKYEEVLPTTRFGKISKFARDKSAYLFSGTEALEEGLQTAAQVGAENYWYKKYQAGDEMDLNFIKGIGELFKKDALSELYGEGLDAMVSTDEGQEALFLGGVSGGVGKARGTYGERKRKDEATKDLIAKSTKASIGDMVKNLSPYTKETMDAVKRGAEIQQVMEASVRQGDVLEYKDAEADYLINLVTPKIKYGKLDLLDEEINTYRQLASTEEGYQQLVEDGKALSTDTRQSYLMRLDNIQRFAKSMQTAYEAFKVATAFEFAKDKNGDIVRDSKGNPIAAYSDKQVDQIIFTAAKIMDYDKRIPELETSLIAAGVDVLKIYEDTEEAKKAFDLIDKLTNIAGKTVTDEVKKDLKNTLSDVLELDARRKLYVKEHNEILSNPRKFDEKPQAKATTAQVVTVKTKEGDLEIKVGSKYLVGEIDVDTKQGFVSKKFPQFEVLALNEDGTIKIKFSDGSTSNVSKDYFSKYKIGTFSAIQKNKKAWYWYKNKDRIFRHFGIKDSSGKPVEGVLRWSDEENSLFFEYFQNNRRRLIRVSNKDFVAKPGYKQGMVVPTNQTLQDIEDANELQTEEEKLEEKLDRRKQIIVNLVKGKKERLEEINKKIENNVKKIDEIDESLDNLKKTKEGLPRKKYTKAIQKTLNELAKQRKEISDESQQLAFERDELRQSIPYLEDILSSYQELPTNTLEMVEEMKEDIANLQALLEVTEDAIQKNGDLLNKIDEILREAYSLLNDYIKRVKEENPQFPLDLSAYQEKLEKYLGEEGARMFVENNEGFTQNIKLLLADIAEFSEELNINVNEKKIEEIEAEIKGLKKLYTDFSSELSAKKAVLDTFEKAIQDEQNKRAEEEKLAKNQQLMQEIFKSASKAEASSGISGGTDETVTERSMKGMLQLKKPVSRISSTTSRDEDRNPDEMVDPMVIRERNFLYNQNFFPDGVRENVKTRVVSVNTEGEFGLTGLVEMSARQNKEQGWDTLEKEELNKILVDADKGVLLAVYILEKEGVEYFIDENGKIIGKVGEEVDLNKIVASTLTSTSLETKRDGKRYQDADKEVLESHQSDWRKERSNLIDNSKVYDIFFSRGIPVYVMKDGKMQFNPLSESFDEDKLDTIKDTEGSIMVITEDEYNLNGVDIKTQKGTVVLQHNSIFAPLTNRKLDSNEQETLYEVIVQLAEQALRGDGFKGPLMHYLQSMLLWGTPKNNKPARNQIWISTDNGLELNFGNSGVKVPFGPMSLQQSENKALLMAFLAGTYNNINNNFLNNEFNNEFIEYYLDNGELKTRTHKNYQSFIIDKGLVKSPLGKGRNLKQIYSVLEGVEFRQPEQKKKVEKQQEEEEQDEDFEEGDKQIFSVKTASGFEIKYEMQGDDPYVLPDDEQSKEYRETKKKIVAATDEETFNSNVITYVFKDVDEREAAKKVTVETVKEEKPQTKRKDRLNLGENDEDDNFRVVDLLRVERMGEQEKQEFKKWVSENLPQFTVEEVEELIRTADNAAAWGKMSGSVLTFYKLAEKGTGYHEAFEAVWKYFATPEEKEFILEEFKNREGVFRDRVSGQTISYAEATDSQAKEKLADEFAEYKLGKKKESWISRLFGRIIKFFRTFLRGFKENTSLRDKLFEKISEGGFKKYKLPAKLSTEEEYSRVPGLSEGEIQAFVQDMAKSFFNQLIREGVDLMEGSTYTERTDILKNIRERYIKSSGFRTIPDYEKVYSLLEVEFKDYMKTMKIEFDENNEFYILDENRNNRDYVDDKFQLDVKKSSPFAIRFLLASLAKTTGYNSATGEIIFDTDGAVLGLKQLVPFNRSFIAMLEAVANSTSFDNAISKIEDLGRKNNDFKALLKILGANKGKFDLSNLKEHQWRLLASAYRTFNLQKPEVRTITYNEDGSVYFSDAYFGRSTKQLINFWQNNISRKINSGESKFFKKNKAGEFEYVDKSVDKYSGSVLQIIHFLNEFGIDITVEDYQKLNSIQRSDVINAANKIKNYISKSKPFKIARGKYLEVGEPISTIAEILSKSQKVISETTFLNSDGKQQQAFVQHNYFSTLSNIFNSVLTLDEFFERFPNLKNDEFSTNSLILKKGGVYFDKAGNRTSTKLTVGYIDGQTKDEKGRKLDNLTGPDKLMLQINGILDNLHYISVPADSSTEWNIDIHNFISKTVSLDKNEFENKFLEIFKGYLQDEIDLLSDKSRSKNDNVGSKWKNLRFFRSILSSETANKIEKSKAIPQGLENTVNKEILDWFYSTTQGLREKLKYNSQLEQINDNTFSIPQLLSKFFGENKLMNERELQGLLTYVSANTAIANMELHKVFFGDPYNFQIKKDGTLDETKRIKSFGSPAIPLFANKAYNSTFTKKFNEGLKPSDFGYYVPGDTIRTTTYADVNIVSDYLDYEGVVEADAAAVHTIFFERDLQNRLGKWGKAEKDWFDWEMAYTRKALLKKGVITQKEYSRELQQKDLEILKNPQPKAKFDVKKPIVRGIKNNPDYTDTILDKFSSSPIWYTGVEGTHLEDLFIKMYKEKIHYVIFESGRKVGSEGKNSFYQGTKFNNEPYKGVFEIKWDQYYIQVENNYEEGKKQTRGSQITKLFSLDLFVDGVPVDFKGTNWFELSEKDKESQSKIYKDVKFNNLLLEQMTDIGYRELLDKLGLEEDEGEFKIVDQEKLYKTLRDEAMKRDMPANLKKIFLINEETNEPYFTIDKSAKYDEIVKMLYSMVDKAIVSPKVNGAPHVQVPATGWESKAIGRGIAIKENGQWKKITQEEYDNLKDKSQAVFTSSKLKFYTKEQPWMEILLPNWMKDLGLTDQEILIKLKSSPEILKAIGFRIPTQGMSAIDNIRIAGFLPEEYGYTVVVPSEITMKAGSDFDIDKLNIYLKNVFVDKDGNLKQYKLLDVPRGDKIKDFYEVNLLERYKKFKRKEEITRIELSADEFLEDIGIASDEDRIIQKLQSQYVPTLEEFEIEVANLDKIEFNRRYNPFFKKAVENEYFDSIGRVISHPKNFERLTKPLDDPKLKEIAAELAKINNTEESKKLSSLLDINYINNLRNTFLMAKKWVGIGAINITGHSQAQRTNLYIDTNEPGLSFEERELLAGEILLPHNKTSDGKPSLSKAFDQENKYISDVLSGYLNAFVDVAKDPYILQIIYDRKIVDIYMFLARIGVPTETVAYFMNQPIIKEYVHYSNIEGFSSLASLYRKELFLKDSKYANSKPATTLTKKLKEQITNPTNEQQLLIFDEFLKYAKLANFSFRFTNSTKWDTTRFTSGGQIRRMELMLDKPNPIVSPDMVLNTSNNVVVLNRVIRAKKAIESLSPITAKGIRNELNKILDVYLNHDFLMQDELEKIDNELVKTFINYLINIRKNINVQTYGIQSVAKLSNILNSPLKRDDFNNNPIFDLLKIKSSFIPGGTEKVTISPFPKTAYEKNLISSYFEEIRELSVDKNGEIITNSLYDNLLKLAILQGIGRYDNLLPYVNMFDVAEYLNINPTISDAQIFVKEAKFQTSNWKDNDIVPYGKWIHESNVFPDVRVIKLSTQFSRELTEHDVVKFDKFPRVRKKGSARLDLTNYKTKNKISKDVVDKMKEKKDFSFLEKVGYKRIMDGDKPFTTQGSNPGEKIYYYYQVNLTGDGNIQDFSKVSPFPNGTVRLSQPLNNEQALDYVKKQLSSKTVTQEKQDESEDPFKCK